MTSDSRPKAGIAHIERESIVVVGSVVDHADDHLLHVLEAGALPRLLPGLSEDWEQDRQQDRNDRDHHQ